MVEDVVEHYKEHTGQFDIKKAETMLHTAIASPLFVYQGKAEKILEFIVEYDETYYLQIPIKCLPNKMWLSTMFIFRKARLHKKQWVQLYATEVNKEGEV